MEKELKRLRNENKRLKEENIRLNEDMIRVESETNAMKLRYDNTIAHLRSKKSSQLTKRNYKRNNNSDSIVKIEGEMLPIPFYLNDTIDHNQYRTDDSILSSNAM
jgi:predicted nuclease with TOPRIM domain